jgi:hypothetical protein
MERFWLIRAIVRTTTAEEQNEQRAEKQSRKKKPKQDKSAKVAATAYAQAFKAKGSKK